ncbi:MAG: hypothetical protein LBP75_07385 [Planctomycetota bacterium]|nr:hypothetical protein [Planctomycetota bacterium]
MTLDSALLIILSVAASDRRPLYHNSTGGCNFFFAEIGESRRLSDRSCRRRGKRAFNFGKTAGGTSIEIGASGR